MSQAFNIIFNIFSLFSISILDMTLWIFKDIFSITDSVFYFIFNSVAFIKEHSSIDTYVYFLFQFREGP